MSVLEAEVLLCAKCGGARFGGSAGVSFREGMGLVGTRVTFQEAGKGVGTGLWRRHQLKTTAVRAVEVRRGRQLRALLDDQEVSGARIAKQTLELISNDEGVESFFHRLVRAWHVLFPSKRRSTSNAEIAKQRLKMILISDRCSVNDEAKRTIVNNIVGALSNFVEIESEDKVQLTVSSDPDLGTVYSVTIPVRRVRPEYQEYSRDLSNVAFMDDFKSVDIRFEYPEFPDSIDAQG